MDHILAELDRKLAGLISVGTIAQLDEVKALVRVEIGELLTDWLQWVTTRAGADRTWWAPEPGEQVLVLAPSGDLSQGVVLPALYQTAHPAPGAAKTLHRTVYADGTHTEYDRAVGVLTVDCVGDVVVKGARTLLVLFGGPVRVETPASVTIDAPTTTLTGNLQVDGAIHSDGDTVAGSISLQNHTHGGIDRGSSNTNPPS
jgi:phage baseplate assembly protein V